MSTHEASRPAGPRSRRWLVIRHLLTGTVTVLVVVAAWMLVTVPVFVVFLIDDAFTYSGYAKAVLWWAGGVSAATLAITPAAVGLERLVLRGGRAWTAMAVLLPIALLAATAACVFAMLKFFLDVHDAYVALAGAAGLMLLFVIYWPTLWTLNLAGYVLRHVARRLRQARSPIPTHPITAEPSG